MDPTEDRESAVWKLAERLHWKMQHLDPDEAEAWGELTDRQREFYKLCVEAIFDERMLSRCALR
jgi:hypothetical protein